ncbi:TAXI family TRAP transporter solute-binding subunit [Rhodospirillaceae bacterium SYSU D60014]|uniref:TAXI family TRAP transporter solute-binding subunit n=1 Tax=Virgifigura deserti TaxID=2268457 RepID=UPI0013C43C4D
MRVEQPSAVRYVVRAAARGLALATLLAAATVAGPMVTGPSSAAEEKIRFFRIGTGSTDAPQFILGGLIASAVSNPPGTRACERGGNCGVPGLIAVAQTTDGSIHNVEAIGGGRLESALSPADVAFWAYTGTGMFQAQGAITNLRAVANLYQGTLQIIVRAESGIDSVDDLKGKRISLIKGDPGVAGTARLVLDAFGVKEKQVTIETASLDEVTARLAAGTLDAVFLLGASPTAEIAELAKNAPIALLPIDGKTGAMIRRKYPFLTVDIVPENAYRGVDQTTTIGVGMLWLVSAELDATLVHDLARALWHQSNRAILNSSDPVGRSIRPTTALVGIPIPLHPGAERFYAEQKR